MADLHFDLHKIPLDDNVYDFFICNHVLEHVEDDRKVLSEIYRVLKPGGTAILQVPLDYQRGTSYENPSITDPKEREVHFGQKDHVRVYGLDYPKRLSDLGFVVDQIAYPVELGAEISGRYRLPMEEILYISKKQ